MYRSPVTTHCHNNIIMKLQFCVLYLLTKKGQEIESVRNDIAEAQK